MSWAPFNSVINSNDVMSEIREKELYIDKPEYTEEQLEELEFKIMESYTSKNTITIDYYQNNKSISIQGTINKIDPIYKRIYINNQYLYFYNIINIK